MENSKNNKGDGEANSGLEYAFFTTTANVESFTTTPESATKASRAVLQEDRSDEGYAYDNE